MDTIQNDLIAALKEYDISVSSADIPKILLQGVDKFTSRRGIILPEKSLLKFYLILSELRQAYDSALGHSLGHGRPK